MQWDHSWFALCLLELISAFHCVSWPKSDCRGMPFGRHWSHNNIFPVSGCWIVSILAQFASLEKGGCSNVCGNNPFKVDGPKLLIHRGSYWQIVNITTTKLMSICALSCSFQNRQQRAAEHKTLLWAEMKFLWASCCNDQEGSRQEAQRYHCLAVYPFSSQEERWWVVQKVDDWLTRVTVTAAITVVTMQHICLPPITYTSVKY